MPGTTTAVRTSFLPFGCNQAAVRKAMSAGIPLFQAFSHIPVRGSTYCDCIKVGVKIDTARVSGLDVMRSLTFLTMSVAVSVEIGKRKVSADG
jgi:hypothetical protein